MAKKTKTLPKAAASGKKKPAAAAPKPKRSAPEATLSRPTNPVIKDSDDSKSPLPAKRKRGLRGAAPWAARHAAKHAAEARARAAEPAPPGSARATIRVPTGAEDDKVYQVPARGT